eukprot:SAG22_NODE_12763_length_430_cov_0.924471_1_plen_106_part_10
MQAASKLFEKDPAQSNNAVLKDFEKKVLAYKKENEKLKRAVEAHKDEYTSLQEKAAGGRRRRCPTSCGNQAVGTSSLSWRATCTAVHVAPHTCRAGQASRGAGAIR